MMITAPLPQADRPPTRSCEQNVRYANRGRRRRHPPRRSCAVPTYTSTLRSIPGTRWSRPLFASTARTLGRGRPIVAGSGARRRIVCSTSVSSGSRDSSGRGPCRSFYGEPLLRSALGESRGASRVGRTRNGARLAWRQLRHHRHQARIFPARRLRSGQRMSRRSLEGSTTSSSGDLLGRSVHDRDPPDRTRMSVGGIAGDRC